MIKAQIKIDERYLPSTDRWITEYIPIVEIHLEGCDSKQEAFQRILDWTLKHGQNKDLFEVPS